MVVRSRAGLTLAVAALVTAAVRAELLRLVLVLRRLLSMRWWMRIELSRRWKRSRSWPRRERWTRRSFTMLAASSTLLRASRKRTEHVRRVGSRWRLPKRRPPRRMGG